MARSVATIGVSVTARTSKFARGMKNAQRQLRAFGASVGRVMRRVARFSAILVTGGVAALTLFVRSQLKAIDSLAKTSSKLGVATEELAGFHHAAKLAGLNAKTFDMALQRMTRRVSEAARDTGEAKDAIKELGLDAKKLNMVGPSVALRMIADALSRVTNQADRVRLAFKLFDSEGVAMINMLQQGRGALDRAADEVRRFGTAISGVQATQIEQANDAITRLKESLRGLGVQFTVAITPVIQGVATFFTDLVADTEWATNGIGSSIDWIVDKLGGLLDTLAKVKVGYKTTLFVMAKGHASLQRAIGEFFYPELKGKTTKEDWEYGLRIEQLENELRKMLGEGLPSASLKDIVENFRIAARQAAEAAAKAVGLPSPRMATAAATGGAPTRFAEVDLSRTYVGGLSGGRGRKQQVTDVDAVAAIEQVELAVKGLQIGAALMGL